VSICGLQPPYRRTDSSEAGHYPSLFDNIDEEKHGHRDDDRVCMHLLMALVSISKTTYHRATSECSNSQPSCESTEGESIVCSFQTDVRVHEG